MPVHLLTSHSPLLMPAEMLRMQELLAGVWQSKDELNLE